MRLGLVTYLWGADWDLPTLIKNCQETGFQGVELRTQHKHGVEPSLSAEERAEVRRRFEGTGVKIVGLGSTCEFQSPDPGKLAEQIETAKKFIVLCHDIGGEGVKVRPNGLPKEVPEAATLAQIGRSLREIAEFGAGYGVEIRLEVHGKGTALLPNIKTIMDAADHPNAKVCWNCNGTDLEGEGLAANFALVARRIGTVHLHDLAGDYPWRDLFALLKKSGFDGWTLCEGEERIPDPVRVMKYYRLLWETMAQ